LAGARAGATPAGQPRRQLRTVDTPRRDADAVRMAMTFYCGSGSPYAWRVWLSLEHLGLPYELKMLSFADGDLHKPEFLALNPRGRVPVLKDGDFVLYESSAIVEYLDDAYGDRGALLPRAVRERAVARRLIREADSYIGYALERLVEELLYSDHGNETILDEAARTLRKEFDAAERAMRGEYFMGAISAVDYTFYPMVALLLRVEQRKRPHLGLSSALGPKLAAWRARLDAGSLVAKTYPPHWKQ
jgi:glutathione S-transferase